MSTSARHTGAPTSRAISVRSYGGVDAISHPFNHNSLNLSTAKAPKRISGMPPLHDVSRDWVKRPEAVTNCWPSLQRDYIGTDKHHELDPWASKYAARCKWGPYLPTAPRSPPPNRDTSDSALETAIAGTCFLWMVRLFSNP